LTEKARIRGFPCFILALLKNKARATLYADLMPKKLKWKSLCIDKYSYAKYRHRISESAIISRPQGIGSKDIVRFRRPAIGHNACVLKNNANMTCKI
jgi:hypothetical protein